MEINRGPLACFFSNGDRLFPATPVERRSPRMAPTVPRDPIKTAFWRQEKYGVLPNMAGHLHSSFRL
jgi:hypothetical protein